MVLAAGEPDPRDRGESVPLDRFLLALDRRDSLPLRRGESWPRRRGESLLWLLGDPEDLLEQRTQKHQNQPPPGPAAAPSGTDPEWAESEPRRWCRRGESRLFR